MLATRYGLVFSSFTHRGKRGLFHRANWNANTYRWAMCDVVFALYDVIPDDDNKLSRLFAAFLSVYMILNQRKFTEECLDALHEKLKWFHRQNNPDSCHPSTAAAAICQMSTRCLLDVIWLCDCKLLQDSGSLHGHIPQPSEKAQVPLDVQALDRQY
jgi:hypothetical protein